MKKSIFTSILLLLPAILLVQFAHAQDMAITSQRPLSKKVLIVVTSHDKMAEKNVASKEKTGYHPGEVAHAWDQFTKAGYEVDFVSPIGGLSPTDGSIEDPIVQKLWKDPVYKKKLDNTLRPADIVPTNYAGIYYAGGHGAMWDLPENKELQDITAKIYKDFGVVGAVCHGPAGLINVKLEDGSYLVNGKTVNSFTNEEETAKGMDKKVPFLLEDKLVERGARFEQSAEFQEHVAVDGRLVTGQNPASAKKVADEMIKVMQSKK